MLNFCCKTISPNSGQGLILFHIFFRSVKINPLGRYRVPKFGEIENKGIKLKNIKYKKYKIRKIVKTKYTFAIPSLYSFFQHQSGHKQIYKYYIHETNVRSFRHLNPDKHFP